MENSQAKKFRRFNPSNPLKSLDSDERIQGNPRESNTRLRGLCSKTAAAQENPNGSPGPASRPSKPEVAQAWMVVRSAAERPVVETVLLTDRQIVDARETHPHQAVLVELPVLVAVAAEPAS